MNLESKLRLLNGLPLRLDELYDSLKKYEQAQGSLVSAFQTAHLYMICRIPFSRFAKFKRNGDKLEFSWVYQGQDHPFVLDIPTVQKLTNKHGVLKFAANQITFEDVTNDTPYVVTPTSLPHDVLQKSPGFDHLNLTVNNVNYEPLYIGKAISQTAFERMVLSPHKRLAEILLDKIVIDPNNKYTVVLMMFEVTSNQDGDIDVVSETEMALINLLKPNYNRIKYKTYPKNSSSISENYDEIDVTLMDSIALQTTHCCLSGKIKIR